jgi:hypothetical protein
MEMLIKRNNTKCRHMWHYTPILTKLHLTFGVKVSTENFEDGFQPIVIEIRTKPPSNATVLRVLQKFAKHCSRLSDLCKQG